MTNTLLFPTDFSAASNAAVPWVRRVAADMRLSVCVLYVVAEPQIYAMLDMEPVPIPSLDELADSAEKRMSAFIAANFAAMPDVTSRIRIGQPADEIVACANAERATLIVMTTHGYSGVRHVLLGSTTEAVLRHASCPVLSVRNN